VAGRCASLVAVLWLVGGPARPLYHREATRLSMACVYAIDAYGTDPEALPRILDEAFDEVDRIDRLMSHYKSDSPLSRVNRDAARRPVPVEPELSSKQDEPSIQVPSHGIPSLGNSRHMWLFASHSR